MNLAGFLAIFSTKDPKFRVYRKLECVYMHESPEPRSQRDLKAVMMGRAWQPSSLIRLWIMFFWKCSTDHPSCPDLSCQELSSWLGSIGQERRTSSWSLLHIFPLSQFFKRGTKPPCWIWAMLQQIRYVSCVIMRAHDCQSLIWAHLGHFSL